MTEIKQIALEILEDLENVAAEAAVVARGRPENVSPGAIIPTASTMVGGPSGYVTIKRSRDSERAALLHLTGEPFIARVVAEDGKGVARTYLFSRATFLHKTENPFHGTLANYKTNLGALAEYEPGEEVEIEFSDRIETMRVIERALVQPQRPAGKWDSVYGSIETEEWSDTPASLRELLVEIPLATDELSDIYGEIESEEAQAIEAASKRDGGRRDSLRALSLRDQAVLDKFQGRIFRLPLSQRIFLSGPAGTGKTTTLIKRLAQKVDVELWENHERESLALVPAESWVMFTPTDLLRTYLKEAFAKERVPAPDSCVKTWASERHRLARDVLKILKSEASGLFLLKKAPLLCDTKSLAIWQLFVAFQSFLERDVKSRISKAFAVVAAHASGDLANLAHGLQQSVGGSSASYDRLFDLVRRQAELSSHDKELGEKVAQEVRRVVSVLTRSHPRLVHELSTDEALLSGKSPSGREGNAVARSRQEKNPLKRALRELEGAIVSLAREKGRKARRSTRYEPIIRWLGARIPSEADLLGLDHLVVLRASVAVLATASRQLLDEIPEAFQRFRRKQVQLGIKNGFYRPDVGPNVRQREITEPEVDVVILAMLRAIRQLTKKPGRIPVGTPLALVSAVQGEYRVQVLVDEATDFSAVQLGCMLGLSDPAFDSFFATGDFQQRMTKTGVQSFEEFTSVAHDFQHKAIDVGYRQSPSLTALSRELAILISDEGSGVKAFYENEPGDVPPLLEEHLADVRGQAAWVAHHVGEIEHILGILPAIAIFVSSDVEISPLETALRLQLEERHVAVRGCPGGHNVGLENEVRIFSAEYIKGLEFEAVFFVGVDRTASLFPELWRQILYVGTTRASRYLGLTCDATLPGELEHIRPHFGTSWSSPALPAS